MRATKYEQVESTFALFHLTKCFKVFELHLMLAKKRRFSTPPHFSWVSSIVSNARIKRCCAVSTVHTNRKRVKEESAKPSFTAFLASLTLFSWNFWKENTTFSVLMPRSCFHLIFLTLTNPSKKWLKLLFYTQIHRQLLNSESRTRSSSSSNSSETEHAIRISNKTLCIRFVHELAH